MKIPDQLLEAAETAKANGSAEVSPRRIVKWYGWERRGSWINEVIREHLRELKVETFPDFEDAYIDATVYLKPAMTKVEPLAPTPLPPEPSSPVVAAPDAVTPAHRISRLKAANTPPLSVKPDETLEKAVTLMLANDFSQLPVMTTPTQVKGAVSWKSIGRRVMMGVECKIVRECMDPHREARWTASLFEVIRDIALHDFVLVRNDQNQITGIVTAADISDQFRTLAEPFLLLGDIETALRRLVESACSLDDLRAARDEADSERPINSAADLTFGEYVRLLQTPANWNKLGLRLDRAVFCEDLDAVRKVRNDVMHFDPDGIDDNQLARLRRFSQFIEEVACLKESCAQREM